MAKHDVLTRKDMKEPDKFQLAATQAANWIATRRRHVAFAGLTVVAAVLLIAVLAAVQARRDERAGAAASGLLESMGGEISSVPLPGFPGPFYASEDARQRAVVTAADRVLAEYPGTGAAELAALAKGDAHLRLHDWDLAKAGYERFLAEAPKGDSLRFGALEGVALAEEGKGNLEAAAEAYARMAREAPSFSDLADLERARVLLRAGKTAEAKELLAAFGERHKDSVLTTEASQQLGRIGGK